MRALTLTRRPPIGGLADALETTELPLPEPGPRQLRVRVVASSINIDDQHMAEGTMMGRMFIGPTPTPARPRVIGTDVAGVVDAIGSKVRDFEVGTSVWGMCGPSVSGPWAEYCLVGERMVAPLPRGWSHQDGAAAVLASAVCISMLNAARLVPRRPNIVVGASGGIGSLLVQALSHEGHEVWAVCSERNAEKVCELGAKRVVDYAKGGYGDQLVALGAEPPANVFDLVGGRDVDAQARLLLRRDGRFVTIVGPERYVGERRLGNLQFASMLMGIGGRMLASRVVGPRYTFTGPTRPDFDAIEHWVVRPGIRPLVERTVPLEVNAVGKAIRHIASHRARGKWVILVQDA